MIDVLIIEDDPMVAKFNGIYLESIEGFNLIGTASDVEEGKAFLEENAVDLILLDVYMGKVTGLDFLSELRSEGSTVDVIVITAANDQQSVQKAIHYGAADYLIKPFSFERFEEAVLRFKKDFQLLNSKEVISQELVDTYFRKSVEARAKKKFDLPKGLTEATFTRIVNQILDRESKVFSVADIAEEVGISRVSVRKYLNYLVKVNLLSIDAVYQETGRPLHLYELKIDKMTILRSYLH